MKRLFIAVISALFLFSCTQTGETEQVPINIKIHGKDYTLYKVFDGTYYIRILVPLDSTNSIPLTVQTTQSKGHQVPTIQIP